MGCSCNKAHDSQLREDNKSINIPYVASKDFKRKSHNNKGIITSTSSKILTSPLSVSLKKRGHEHNDKVNEDQFKDILDSSQQERSDTCIKWYILILGTTLWSSAYNCLLSVSALESTMLDELNMNNTQFALLSSIVFFVAILSAFISPWITSKFGIYWTLIIASFAVILGQSLFTFGIELILYIDMNTGHTFNYSILYIGRGLIGFGLGIEDVSVSTVATLWFGKSRWLSLSLIILSQTVDIGIITARDVLPPIMTHMGKHNLARPFYFGILFGFVALLSSVIMLYLEKQYIKHSKLFKNKSVSTTINLTKLDRDFCLIKEFPFHIWLCIIFIMISCAQVETFSTQMTDAFVSTFHLTQWNADMLMSLTSVCGVFLCPIWGYIVSKWGGLTYFAIMSQIAMIFASLVLGYNVFINELSDKYLIYGAWMAMIGFVLAQEWYVASAFTMLYSTCPVYLISVINSINAMLYLFGGVIITYLFGVFADQYGYKWSNIMMAGFSLFGLIIAIWIHWTGSIKTYSQKEQEKIQNE